MDWYMLTDVVCGIGILIGIVTLIYIGKIFIEAHKEKKKAEKDQITESQREETNGTVKVFYAEYYTNDVPTKYIKFLEEFDESKYKIINISISTYQNVVRYYVTYKIIN